MDICFHYFAVKTVARAAGYREEQAQRIAAYSQLMDDYDWQGYLRAENMPDYLKRAGADVIYNETLKIVSPVATGFPSVLDMVELILPRAQKLIVSPFHFIPRNERRVSNGDLRTVPAKLRDGSYISSMLDSLEEDMASNSIAESDALMKMGMLLHTFADTYAHQLFTGYNNKTNSVKLISAKDNITQADATKEYGYWVEQWISQIEEDLGAEIPTIGHMSVVSIPAANVLGEDDVAELGTDSLMLSGGEFSDDFYKFTLFADEHLINLYGNHPRKLLAAGSPLPYDNTKTPNDNNTK